jgi:glutamine synthetase
MKPTPPASLAADFSARGVRDVECLFPDVSGYPRGKLMPAAAFAAGAELRIAQAIPMQCVTGEYSCDPIFPDQDPDVILLPDYATVRPVPWCAAPRALAIHDCLELDGSPCDFAPRGVQKNVLAR